MERRPRWSTIVCPRCSHVPVPASPHTLEPAETVARTWLGLGLGLGLGLALGVRVRVRARARARARARVRARVSGVTAETVARTWLGSGLGLGVGLETAARTSICTDIGTMRLSVRSSCSPNTSK